MSVTDFFGLIFVVVSIARDFFGIFFIKGTILIEGKTLLVTEPLLIYWVYYAWLLEVKKLSLF